MSTVPVPSPRACTAPPLQRGAMTPSPWFGFWRGLLFALWPGQRWPRRRCRRRMAGPPAGRACCWCLWRPWPGAAAWRIEAVPAEPYACGGPHGADDALFAWFGASARPH